MKYLRQHKVRILVFILCSVEFVCSHDNVPEKAIRSVGSSVSARSPSAATCDGNGTTGRGTCMPRSQCRRQGGTASTTCGFLMTCCTRSLECGGTSSLKYTTLRSPAQPMPTSCVYRIEPASSSVCQLRIDFESFTLSQPTIANGFYQCLSDAMRVSDFTLCGENAKQHFYVPFNVSGGDASVDIQFEIAQRLPTVQLPAKWVAHVAQLECPGMLKNARASTTPRKISTATETATATPTVPLIKQSNEMNSVDARTLHQIQADASDAFLIAPHGCLQYYPHRSGTFESFNFNNGNGPYLGDMNYAICFRRSRQDVAISFVARTFQLPEIVTGDNANAVDSACYTSVPTVGRSEDYLFIPEAIQVVNNIRASRFCGKSMTRGEVLSATPGSFAVNFHSDQQFDETENGFIIDYSIK